MSSGDITAGFVFYQTKNGFKFKSIDGLMKQEPKNKNTPYYYTEVNVNEILLVKKTSLGTK